MSHFLTQAVKQLTVYKTPQKIINYIEYYGVKFDNIQAMKFSQHLNSSESPAMNTLTKEECFDYATNYLIQNPPFDVRQSTK